MAGGLRLWQRDKDALHELARSPYTTSQLARLVGFSSAKKASERFLRHHRAGLLKRLAMLQASMQGKAEFVCYRGEPPHYRTLPHTLQIAEARVQTAEWQVMHPAYALEFFFASEVQLRCGLLPDATIIVRKQEHNALLFLEMDLGTEPVHSNTGYSLAGKLRSYAAYFDSASYQEDFSWAGPFAGFRVLLVLPPGRLPQVQALVQREGFDFVQLTTTTASEEEFYGPIWRTPENTIVDALGRPGELPGELAREKVATALPTTPSKNAFVPNTLRATPEEGF